MDSGSYQLAEKVIITITIVICPSGCVKAWGRFIVRLPPLRRQMRPSPVRSGSNRPSRSQASHFQSLPKAGLQTKYLHVIQGCKSDTKHWSPPFVRFSNQPGPHWNLKSNVSYGGKNMAKWTFAYFQSWAKIFHNIKEVSNMALFAFNIYFLSRIYIISHHLKVNQRCYLSLRGSVKFLQVV